MQIPQLELIELDANWAPWKFQVNSFGDAIHYGHSEHFAIRTGMSNHETRESAESLLKSLTYQPKLKGSVV